MVICRDDWWIMLALKAAFNACTYGSMNLLGPDQPFSPSSSWSPVQRVGWCNRCCRLLAPAAWRMPPDTLNRKREGRLCTIMMWGRICFWWLLLRQFTPYCWCWNQTPAVWMVNHIIDFQYGIWNRVSGLLHLCKKTTTPHYRQKRRRSLRS